MSTSASVAQFMAILSGGVNPSTLKSASIILDENKQQHTVNFEKFLGNGLSETKNPLLANAIAQQASSANGNIIDASTYEQLQSLLSDHDLPNANSAQIWRFIQQQASANIDTSNQLVLNLSEKGLDNQTIEALKSIFGENDLVTIIKDPKLNAQFDDALNQLETTFETTSDTGEPLISNQQSDDAKLDVESGTTLVDSALLQDQQDSEDPELEAIAAIIDGILSDNKNDIQNTMTFSADQQTVTENAIAALLLAGNNNGTKQSNENIPVKIQPQNNVELSLMQNNIMSDTPAPQFINKVADSINPFSFKSMVKGNVDGNINPTDMEGISIPDALKPRLSSDILSTIAERIALVQNNNQGGSALNDFTTTAQNLGIDVTAFADGEFTLPFEAAFKTASQASNPVTSIPSAAQSHIATQTVAISLTKMAQNAQSARGGENNNQQYRLRLDPPELGRVDIEVKFNEKDNKVQAVIMADRPETLGLLQRDMHSLVKAMMDAGFENASSHDFSFDLAQDNTNEGGSNNMNHGENQNQSQTSNIMGDDEQIIMETEMSVIIDPITGQKHVNMLV